MANLLSYCSEMGSVSIIKNIIENELKNGHNVFDCSPNFIHNYLKKNCDKVKKINSKKSINNFDVLIGGIGHPLDLEFRNTWINLNKNIKSIAFFDHWKGLGRFYGSNKQLDTNLLPDFLYVIDDNIKNEINKLFPNFETIRVSGNLSLLELDKRIRSKSKKNILNKLSLDPNYEYFFLASEIIHDHPINIPCNNNCKYIENAITKEGTTILNFLKQKFLDKKINLILRPHPRQKIKNKILDKVKVIDWNIADDEEIISVSDKVIGLSSMILVKAKHMGVSVYNLEEDLKNWRPENSFLSEKLWKKIKINFNSNKHLLIKKNKTNLNLVLNDISQVIKFLKDRK